jgi:capsular polysaccharide export protein
MLLIRKGNLLAGDVEAGVGHPTSTASSSVAYSVPCEPFLRVPPFPGAKAQPFLAARARPVDVTALVTTLRLLRVGGTYWAAQPPVPEGLVLVADPAAVDAAQRTFSGASVWSDAELRPSDSGVTVVTGECDPWHMLERATAFISDRKDERTLIASLLGVPCYAFDSDRQQLSPFAVDLQASLAELAAAGFQNPFTDDPMNAIEAAELCGFWRRMVDSNREIIAAVGFAFWKQDHVAPLLWGAHRLPFLRTAVSVSEGQSVAVWRAKAAPKIVAELERKGARLIEVEDGFLRSRGLGADCIPPLSLTIDRLGPHFDPAQPSELERLLEDGEFDDTLLARARQLRSLIVEAGIGKYGSSTAVIDRPAGARRHILVPGQVEDDRAVQAGGCGLTSNLELLKRVREQAPDAYILYKPHPDVLAGHRRGAIGDRSTLRFADEIVGELPIASLIGMVDEVHVNTSLAGFEALLREKKVTTYGVPFYAGWGLTQDLGPVPGRRTTVRSLDELVAATLLLYPRYLDPVTGLPCPAEIIVERLSASQREDANLIVGMRRLQGKFMRRLRSFIQ